MKFTAIISKYPSPRDEGIAPAFHSYKEYILKIIKMPGPMRMVWGSALAYWLSGIINPAFIAIAIMIVLFIPVLIVDPYFPSRPEE